MSLRNFVILLAIVGGGLHYFYKHGGSNFMSNSGSTIEPMVSHPQRYASYYKIDFLFTWNRNHLANANKKQHIRIINSRMNLFTPEIITPLELFTETAP